MEAIAISEKHLWDFYVIVLLQKLCALPPSNTARLVLSIAFWQHKSLSVWVESRLIRLHQTREVE